MFCRTLESFKQLIFFRWAQQELLIDSTLFNTDHPSSLFWQPPPPYFLYLTLYLKLFVCSSLRTHPPCAVTSQAAPSSDAVVRTRPSWWKDLLIGSESIPNEMAITKGLPSLLLFSSYYLFSASFAISSCFLRYFYQTILPGTVGGKWGWKKIKLFYFQKGRLQRVVCPPWHLFQASHLGWEH